MGVRTIDLGMAIDGETAARHQAPREPGPVTAERMNAVLRWRTRWLRRTLPSREAQAVRLLPVLFQASVPIPALRGEPPGIEGLFLRRSATTLTRVFDLPPPIARQRGRRLVAGILATTGPRLEIFVICAHGIGTAERTRLETRASAIEDLFAEKGVKLAILVMPSDPAQLAVDLVRPIAFGALLAGRLPEATWQQACDRTVPPEELGRLVELAPTPLCAQAMVLMMGGAAPAPAAVLRKVLVEHSAGQLADPDVFCAHWSSLASQSARLLFDVLCLRVEGRSREPERPVGITPSEVMRLGRDLALAAVAALRRAPKPLRKQLMPWLRREILMHGMPGLLLPALARSFRALDANRRGPPLFVRRRGGRRSFEACDSSGAPLTCGASPEQAILRSLVLLSRATGELPALEDPAWTPLGKAFARPVERRTLLLAVRPAPTLGAPHDPLNRGTERSLGFADVLAVTLRPQGRPSVRRLPPLAAVERLVVEATRGSLVEAVAVTGDAHPATGRLQRVAQLCRNNAGVMPPLAIEAGGQIFVVQGGGVLRRPLVRFASRPRHCTADPEAPDLSPWAEDRVLQSPFGGHQAIVSCHVTRWGDHDAFILYVDPAGYQLHEQVPLHGLEEYLTDAQAILRAGPSPMLLMVRYSKEVELAVPHYSLTGAEARVQVDVAGRLPFGLQAVIMGEKFGASSELGWAAAAQAVLSAWPSGAQGLLSCKTVTVDLDGRLAVGLSRLYARSAALRRLKLHVGKACRA